MDSLNLNSKSPAAFILTAGGCPDTGTEEDQVWSLVFNHTDTNPFYLYTTYGLKARKVQVYPEITAGDQQGYLVENFHQPPAITHYTPGFIRLFYLLTNKLAVIFEALTPEPSVLLGLTSLENQGDARLNLRFGLIFQFLPLGKGKQTHAEQVDSHQILTAQTDGLAPVLFVTGGPTASFNPLPALTLPVQIAPGESQTIKWVLAAKHTQMKSFKAAKNLAGRSWHGYAQKHLMDHAQLTIKIQTGNPDWDAAFHLAQTIPYTHFIPDNSGGIAPHVVRNRLPDQRALDPYQVPEKDDLTVLELTHLSQVLLPQRPALMASLVVKFLNRLQKDGQLHAKRNASPFMKPYREAPLLAGLSLEIYEVSEDQTFLQEAFPALQQIAHKWCFEDNEFIETKPFSWQTPDQTQLNSGHYLFDTWEENGGGLDIQSAESPALVAMLRREVRSLRKIAGILGFQADTRSLARLETALENELFTFWHDKPKMYLYRDIQSRISTQGEEILLAKAENAFMIDRWFTHPQRLVCHLHASDERTRVCHLAFTGLDHLGGEFTEIVKPHNIHWISGRAHLTTINLFSYLKSLKIKGLSPTDDISLETADFSRADITCLAPVWSGDLPRTHLNALLDNPLDWQHPGLSRGIPEVLPASQGPPEGVKIAVNVLWNSMIIQGLARNGSREPASGIFSHLMATIIQGLKNYGGFFPFFQIEDGRPLGEKNALAGLAPLRLFLEIAGVRILTPKKIALWGNNPFPWPIKLNWRGLTLHRGEIATRITFPDGTNCTCESTDPLLITPESGEA